MIKDIQKIGVMDFTKKDSKNYFSKSKELTPLDFDPIKTYLLRSKACTFVMFYAPWCKYCKKLKLIWTQLGKTATFIDVCAFNCEKYKDHIGKMAMDKFAIQTYPTLVLYKNGKPVRYKKDRTLADLLNFCIKYC